MILPSFEALASRNQFEVRGFYGANFLFPFDSFYSNDNHKMKLFQFLLIGVYVCVCLYEDAVVPLILDSCQIALKRQIIARHKVLSNNKKVARRTNGDEFELELFFIAF